MGSLQTRTVEEIVLGLALREKESCGYDRARMPEFCTCLDHDCLCHSHGFREVHGQVAEFPMLQEPCSRCQGRGYLTYGGHSYPCGRCGGEPGEPQGYNTSSMPKGRGWVPIVTTDALLEAGKPWRLGVFWDSENYAACRDGEEIGYYSKAANNALALALEAAVKGGSDAS